MSETLDGKRLYYKEPTGFQWWWLIWVAAGICVFLCGTAIGVVSLSGGGGPGGLVASSFGDVDHLSILMVGTDNSSDRGLADTIMYVMVYPKTGEIAALSIPRDSRVEVPGAGVTRINASHSVGGMPLTVQTVEQLLGLPVDKYIEVNVPGLVKLVDAIGGVDLDVPKRMHYTDRSQKLYIDLQPGFQHLTGYQAMGYVRFRHDAVGDIGRMERQRQFMHAVMKKLFASNQIASIPKAINTFLETVNTDLTYRDMLFLKGVIDTSGADAIRTMTLPADPVQVGHASMLQVDPVKVKETVDKFLLHQGTAVEVLNGAGQEGLASRVAETLKEQGCDIVNVGNSAQPTDTTLVIDHRGSARRAERVAGWLGVGAITVDPDAQNPADVTVILGKDYLLEKAP